MSMVLVLCIIYSNVYYVKFCEYRVAAVAVVSTASAFLLEVCFFSIRREK